MRLKYFDFEVELGPAPILVVDNIKEESAPAFPERKGRDGLTPTQQIEFYGRVVDTEE